MPRPSQRIDEALLHSGRELFPQLGCAGLSVRAVAERAGANQGMFHYHFKTKDNFLRVLLQQMYEEMFAGLSGEVRHEGPALERLSAALLVMGRFAREHRRLMARLWMDAMAGEPVAREFFQRNLPRHLTLLIGLMQEAQAEGALGELAPLQRFVFVMGSVLMPILFASGLFELVIEHPALQRQFAAQVMSDEAIAQRVSLALAALGGRTASSPVRRARTSRRRAPASGDGAAP
ncbi:MAG: TetR/AcrR family transcriptional regulator [Burkholderiaceae bacterium]